MISKTIILTGVAVVLIHGALDAKESVSGEISGAKAVQRVEQVERVEVAPADAPAVPIPVSVPVKKAGSVKRFVSTTTSTVAVDEVPPVSDSLAVEDFESMSATTTPSMPPEPVREQEKLFTNLYEGYQVEID